MHVKERQSGDVDQLKELIQRERNAKQRDRYRIALLAIEGREKLEIASILSVAKSTVENWAYRYRDGGIAALTPKPYGGSTPRLNGEQAEAFKKRFANGPKPEDGVCTLRGKDAQKILNEEFGVDYSLSTVYDALHRLNFSCLKPRPKHEKNDPEQMAQFKRSAPFLSRE
jgi:transposase